MTRKTAQDFDQELLNLYDRYAHGLIDRCFAGGEMELVGDYAAPLPALGLAGLVRHAPVTAASSFCNLFRRFRIHNSKGYSKNRH